MTLDATKLSPRQRSLLRPWPADSESASVLRVYRASRNLDRWEPCRKMWTSFWRRKR